MRGHALDLSRLPLGALGLPGAVHAGVVELSADVRGTLRAPEAQLQVEGHGLSVSGVDGLEVTLEAGYEHGRARATLNAAVHGGVILAARAESGLDLQRIVDGQPWREVPLTADASIPSFDLSAVPKLGGTLQGRAEVRGTLAHPTAKAELHARQLALSGLRFAELDARAAWDGRELTAKLDGAALPKGALHLDARLPVDRNAPVHATLRAEALTLAIEDLGSLRRLEGTLNADLQLHGPRAHATLAGFLKIDHGAFAGGSDPRLYQDLSLDVAAQAGGVELHRMVVEVGGGKLTAHGRFGLDGLRPTAVDLVVDADRFPFQARNAEAWIDARLELRGRQVGDTLQGDLTVSQGTARLPTLEAAQTLQSTAPLEDVEFVGESGPRRRKSAEAEDGKGRLAAAHVVAHIPGPFRIESPEMLADLRGELEVRMTEGEPRIYGHVETTAGRFGLLGRQYEIERARASFNGEIDPVIDVRLTRPTADATVVVEVHGTARDPELELRSDPPIYDASQIIGIIVSGDPDSQRIDTPSIDQRLVGAISGVLVSKIRDQIAPGLPIDVIKLETGADRGTGGGLGNARLEVGKYLRENIYISYVHQFGTTMSDVHRTNAHEANVEYRFRRHLVVGARWGDAGVGAVDLSWTLRY